MVDETDTLSAPICELILYACPTGELAEQLDRYFAASCEACGPNAAHRYMPHITLTGFFHDTPDSIPFYVRQVGTVVAEALAAEPDPAVLLTQIGFQENFHMIQVESPWLKQLTVDFINRAAREGRHEAIRKKDWLHLSLAYEFPASQHATLQALAEHWVHLDAPVRWEIRFYERHPDNSWTCHGAWPLSMGG